VKPDAPIPSTIWAIAMAGMAPFPLGAATYVYGPADLVGPALTVLLTWSAVTLGFLGGVRWGLESGREDPRVLRLAACILWPLAGWALLFARGMADPSVLLAGYLVVFMLQWLFDRAAPDTPSHYPRLLTVLTLGSCLSLAVALEQALRM